jgi:RHS repeat-associated protein
VSGAQTYLSYNADFQLTQVALPTSSGLTVTQGYPGTHTPDQIAYSDGGIQSVLGVSYSYTTAAQLKERIDHWLNDGSRSGRAYSYDLAGRLTGYANFNVSAGQYLCQPGTNYPVDPVTGQPCWTDGTRTTSDSSVYGYDRVGNRSDSNAVVTAGNRLVRFRGDSMTYDLDGNLTRRWTIGGGFDQSYSWNSIGQLTSVSTTGGTTVNFTYDGFGRRASKSTSSSTSNYLWDGDNLFAELDGSWNRVAEYTYYPGVDRPHSVRRWSGGTGTMYYFANDYPGSVVGMIDASGNLDKTYHYQPFGTIHDSTGTPANALHFGARELDGETGLYFLRNRYYDTSLGRFLAEDPLGLEGGLNGYAYVEGDPINSTDPYGLCESTHTTFTPLGDGAWQKVVECVGGGPGQWVSVVDKDPLLAFMLLGKVLNQVGELSGLNDLGRGADDLMAGNIAGGTFSIAMGLPVGPKELKLFKARGAGLVRAKQAAELARYLGFTERVKDVPFAAKGMAVFSNGRVLISIDRDSHIGGVWKMFNLRGERLGTFDALLNYLGR